MQENEKKIKEEVKKHYSDAILTTARTSSCCGTDELAQGKYASLAGYSNDQLNVLPQGITAASFGCGNPVSFMEIKEGETVLDLGCGPGLDLFLAAAKVGSSGKVIGLDMTPEMIDKANENITNSKAANIEVRLGEMESMPIDDNSIDWVISNCVINLAPDKKKVFDEIFRVLKPGGKILVSDIVTTGELPEEVKNDPLAWSGCMAGAMMEDAYLDVARQAGLEKVKVIDRLDYDRSQMVAFASGCCSDGQDCLPPNIIDGLTGKLSSVRVSGGKPA